MKNECPLQCYSEKTKHYFCTFDRSADCGHRDYRLCRTLKFWALEQGILEDKVDDEVCPPTAQEIIRIVEEQIIPSISIKN